MQNKKYFELQKEAQLSNTQAAELLEVNISTIKRWRNGDLTAPKAVLMALEFESSKISSWIVTINAYDFENEVIIGVFSSETKADLFIEMQSNPSMYEKTLYDIDELHVIKQGY